MATSNAQRWGIIAILVVTVVGTLGSFAVLGLATKNDASDAAERQKAVESYQASYEAYQARLNEQAKELSATHYGTFQPYSSRVSAFDRDSVKELGVNDLVVGEGEEITGTTTFAAYYIGWNPKGKVFDGSIEGESLKSPLPVDTGLDAASLIEGWKEGMKGMRIGGVREITIPSDKAYGEQGSGDDIPPNTPIRFVVMAIESPAPVAEPEVPAELLQSYGNY